MRLNRARDELDKLVQWFADQRLLDAIPLATEPFPRFRDSVRHLTSSTTKGVSTVASGLKGVMRRSPKPDQTALPPSDTQTDQTDEG